MLGDLACRCLYAHGNLAGSVWQSEGDHELHLDVPLISHGSTGGLPGDSGRTCQNLPQRRLTIGGANLPGFGVFELLAAGVPTTDAVDLNHQAVTGTLSSDFDVDLLRGNRRVETLGARAWLYRLNALLLACTGTRPH